MKRLLILAALVALPSEAHAKLRDTPAARDACRGELVRFCLTESVKSCPRCVWRCLRREDPETFSPECRAVIR